MRNCQKWEMKLPTENFGGVTGSEGDVLFATGTLDKKFYVFDSINGNILYSKIMPFIGSSPPTTYSINENNILSFIQLVENRLRLDIQT